MSASILSRAAAVEHDAAVTFAYLRHMGVRFNASAKVEEAAEFSLKAGGSALAIPSKMAGVSAFQTAAESLASGAFGKVAYRILVCRRVDDERPGRAGLYRLALHAQGCLLGFVADKHAAWLLPLLTFEADGFAHGAGIAFHALAVTGGDTDRGGFRKMRGVNFCITGVAAAIRRRYGINPGGPEDEPSANHYAAEIESEALLAAQEDAYASGTASRIHALTDAEFAIHETQA